MDVSVWLSFFLIKIHIAMKKITTIVAAILLVAASAFTFQACKKDSSSSGTATYKIRMTDAPGPYTAVNIDIQSVEVIRADGSTATLATHAGIYNLLDFNNGIDTLVASGQVSGSVEQIRFILGPNSTLVVDGNTVPLTIPSGQESGLKVNVQNATAINGVVDLLIDFDANQSIVALGNGGYHLKPVLRAIVVSDIATGRITGHVSVPGTIAVVTATGAAGTFSTVLAVSGYFVLVGIPAGSYTLTVTPPAPAPEVTRSNVDVHASQTTDVGMITL